MGGGAWPFLVGGVICLVNSVNERDPRLLNSGAYVDSEVGGNNRSVMPLDVLGRTRATLTPSASLSPWARAPGNLGMGVVIGIDYCNY
ncbi:unnamed protein product [Phaeothamnion confervicola]